jgi:hypothetical protein
VAILVTGIPTRALIARMKSMVSFPLKDLSPLEGEVFMEELPKWKRHYIKRRGEAIAFLGGKCVICQSEDSLEFDHIDPEQKSFSVGAVLTHAWSKLEPELKKCQLLCQDCHRTKSKVDGSLEKMKRSFMTRVPQKRDVEGRFVAANSQEVNVETVPGRKM